MKITEGQIWKAANCNNCGCEPDPPYTNGQDKTVLCEKCAVEEFKTKNPFWSIKMLKGRSINIINFDCT